MQRHPAVVAYDISHNKTRRKIHHVLKRWRIDGQKSVHECLLSRHEAQALFIELGELIDPATDKLFLAWLSPDRAHYNKGLGRSISMFETQHHLQ